MIKVSLPSSDHRCLMWTYRVTSVYFVRKQVCARIWVKCIILTCQDVCSFFFQAEDGIRDVAVTGVQTCALPISRICGGGNVCRSSPWGQDCICARCWMALPKSHSAPKNCASDCVPAPTRMPPAIFIAC